MLAREGPETIAAVLLAEGSRIFRRTLKTGAPRGLFCGMGTCYDCLVTVNGVAATLTATSFTAEVPLLEGANPITARATKTTGKEGTAGITLVLDTMLDRRNGFLFQTNPLGALRETTNVASTGWSNSTQRCGCWITSWAIAKIRRVIARRCRNIEPRCRRFIQAKRSDARWCLRMGC